MRKYGISSVAFERPIGKDIFTSMKRVKDMGYQVFELMENDIRRIDVEGIREASEKLGLEVTICAFHDGNSYTGDISSNSELVRKTGLKFIKDMVDLAEKLKVSYITGPFYATIEKMHKRSYRGLVEIYGWAVENMKIAAEYAGEKGISIGIEPCRRDCSDLINSAADCAMYIDDIGFDNVGFKLDTSHMCFEEDDIYSAVKLAGKKLLSVHLGGVGRGAPSDPDFNWTGFKKGLDDIGYEADLTHELFSCGNLEKDIEIAKSEFIAMKKIFG